MHNIISAIIIALAVVLSLTFVVNVEPISEDPIIVMPEPEPTCEPNEPYIGDDPMVCYKPVIYLYPEEEMPVSVRIDPAVVLTCTYPEYMDGWRVTAAPDGTLTADGAQYSYLYWEGDADFDFDMDEGFCIKGEDTAVFLEDILPRLGLNRREANEFIVYWLPQMQKNPYNIITFQTDAYTDVAALSIDPAPDALIRVFMVWRASDEAVEIAAPEIAAPVRAGFTAVEWGGTEIK